MRFYLSLAAIAILVAGSVWWRQGTNIRASHQSPQTESHAPDEPLPEIKHLEPTRAANGVNGTPPLTAGVNDASAPEDDPVAPTVREADGRLPEPWGTSRLIAQSESRIEGQGLFQRITILESPDQPWPIRVEETIRRPMPGGKEKRLKAVEMVANHLLVGFPDGPDRAAIQTEIEQQGFTVTQHESDPSLVYIGPIPLETDSLPSAIQQIQSQTLPPEYAEPDYLLRALAMPNDPAFQEGRLWGLHNIDEQEGRVDADIDGPEAWDIKRDASEIIVAVIDTGIRYTHQDLAENMWVNEGEIPGDGLDNDGNGVVDDIHGLNARDEDLQGDPNDDNGHGTHCAGTIGAVGNNGLGLTGVAWNVQLMAARFLGGPDGTGSTADSIECIDYAVRHGAHIINASYGGGSRSRSALNAITRAQQAGVIFVAAAGNESLNNDLNAHYPSAYHLDNIVAVASHDRHDQLSGFSNFGAQTVDIAAPGTDIYSTVSTSDDAYANESGTSMAAPHVSGILAVIRSTFPDDDPQSIIDRLYATGVEHPSYIGRVATGRRANLQAALETESFQPLPFIVSTLEDSLNGRRVFDLGESLTLSVEVHGEGPFTYQWQHNGTIIPSARSSRFNISSLRAEDHGEFQVRVSHSGSSVSSRTRIAVKGPIAAIGEAVEAKELEFYSVSESRWGAQSIYSRDGDGAAESGPIGNRETTEMEVSVVGPGIFSFWWQVDSEDGYDFLRFSVNDQEISSITGDSGWLKVEQPLDEPGQPYRLKWKYEKDFSDSDGLDRGWVDQVSFLGDNLIPPTIATQPHSITAALGSTATLSVVAEGSPPLSYQWFKDGQAIADALSRELTFVDLQASDQASYGVEVTNGKGKARSRDVAVRLQLIAPTITREPEDKVVDEGDPLSLSIEASGTVPMTFEWWKDGSVIPGATLPTLSIPATKALDSGSYQALVRNAAGTASSQTVSVRVNEITLLPMIATQPQSIVVNQDEPVVLKVSATGDGPLSYQWFRNGEAILGGGDATLRIEQASTIDTGTYNAVVTNPFGSATSREAHVEVRQRLDDLGAALDNQELNWTTSGNAIWFTQGTETTDGEDAAQAGAIDPLGVSALHTSVTGPGLLSFQWKVSSEEWFDELTLLIDGEFADGISGTSAWNNIQIPIDSGIHSLSWVYTKDDSINAGQDTAWLDRVVFASTLEAAPLLTRQPSNVALLPNEAVVFTADAVGGNDIQWQWFHEGSPILGATHSRFEITLPGPDHAGTYFAEATNSFGTTRTREVDLSFVGFGQAIAEGLDEDSVVWVNDDHNPWRIDFDEHIDQTDSISVAYSSEADATAFETTVEGPAVVSFWWAIAFNEEADHDFVFQIDGKTASYLWSPDFEDAFWWEETHVIPPGEHVLRWEFDDLDEWTEDSGGWVDQLELSRPPSNPEAYNPPLDTNGLTWNASGDAPWIILPMSLARGENALRTGALSDGQSSSLSVDVDFAQPTVVEFEWMTVSEANYVYGRFDFFVDGVLAGRIEDLDDVFNENFDVWSPFRSHAFRVGAGSHRLEWRYERLFSILDGESMDGGGVLDGILFTPTSDAASETFSSALDVAPQPLNVFNTLLVQPWAVSEAEPWLGDSSLEVRGEFEGRSYLELPTAAEEAIAFHWRLNAASPSDRLFFELDSETISAAERGPLAGLSGASEWQQELILLPPGEHHLRWIYERRGTLSPVSTGQLDAIQWLSHDEALNAVLESSLQNWSVLGDAPWRGLRLPEFGRDNVLVSAPLGVTERVEIKAGLSGPGQLRFDWFTALTIEDLPASLFNSFRFKVNDSVVAQIDRPSDWATVVVEIPPGDHELTWTYATDFIGLSGNAFLDQVIYEPESASAKIQYERTTGGLRLTWIDADDTVRLEACESLASPEWVPVEGVQSAGSERSIVVDFIPGQRYFRLAD